jgi:hypothetical protein
MFSSRFRNLLRLTPFSIVGQSVYHRIAKPIVELLVGPEGGTSLAFME